MKHPAAQPSPTPFAELIDGLRGGRNPQPACWRNVLVQLCLAEQTINPYRDGCRSKALIRQLPDELSLLAKDLAETLQTVQCLLGLRWLQGSRLDQGSRLEFSDALHVGARIVGRDRPAAYLGRPGWHRAALHFELICDLSLECWLWQVETRLVRLGPARSC